MTAGHPRILALGLGNDILGDDAVGLLAVRRLRVLLPVSVEVVEATGAGLDLLDLLEGYDKALILDAIMTGKHPAGTILEFSADDFRQENARSPHYAGLPTVLQLAESLDVVFPKHIQIVAVEVENPYEVREGLSARAESAIPAMVERANQIVTDWLHEGDNGGRVG